MQSLYEYCTFDFEILGKLKIDVYEEIDGERYPAGTVFIHYDQIDHLIEVLEEYKAGKREKQIKSMKLSVIN